MTTDNLPLSSAMEDKSYSELVQQPRLRVADIASGGASILVPTDRDIQAVLGFIVFDADGEFVVVLLKTKLILPERLLLRIKSQFCTFKN